MSKHSIFCILYNILARKLHHQTRPSSLKLLSYMKQTCFTSLGEDVCFDQNGDPIASYDLMNWQPGSDGSLRLEKVGFYDASIKMDRDLVINESVITWHTGNKVCGVVFLTRSSSARLIVTHLFCILDRFIFRLDLVSQCERNIFQTFVFSSVMFTII